jgi:hypothetical protein
MADRTDVIAPALTLDEELGRTSEPHALTLCRLA